MPDARVGAPWYESIGFEKLGLESLDWSLGGWWRIKLDFNLYTSKEVHLERSF